MTRCVQFVAHEIAHRAAIAIAEPDRRRYDVWQDEFEQEYNVKFGTLQVDGCYTMIFPSDKDYTMFMLRWA